MSNAVPSTLSVLWTMMGVTLRRLVRGRAVWVVGVIAVLPLFLVGIVRGRSDALQAAAQLELIVMALLPSVLVASAIGEELEDRTTTYLWSRPIARSAMVAGKLLGLAPVAVLLVVGGWLLTAQAMATSAVPLRMTLAFGAGALTVSMIAAGIALLVPRQGMALSIIYLMILDRIIGEIPASLQQISVSRQVNLIGALDQPEMTKPAVTLAVIAAVWLAMGLLRLRRLES